MVAKIVFTLSPVFSKMCYNITSTAGSDFNERRNTMTDNNQTTEDVFYNLSEEEFSAILKFSRLSDGDREKVMLHVDKLMSNK